MVTYLPVAPEHISLASSMATLTGLQDFPSKLLAIEAPVIPDPMMTTSAYTGKSDKCFAIGDGGTVQKDTEGFGTGKPGSIVRRRETAL